LGPPSPCWLRQARGCLVFCPCDGQPCAITPGSKCAQELRFAGRKLLRLASLLCGGAQGPDKRPVNASLLMALVLAIASPSVVASCGCSRRTLVGGERSARRGSSEGRSPRLWRGRPSWESSCSKRCFSLVYGAKHRLEQASRKGPECEKNVLLTNRSDAATGGTRHLDAERLRWRWRRPRASQGSPPTGGTAKAEPR
jgi:hypothetical protein